VLATLVAVVGLRGRFFVVGDGSDGTGGTWDESTFSQLFRMSGPFSERLCRSVLNNPLRAPPLPLLPNEVDCTGVDGSDIVCDEGIVSGGTEGEGPLTV